MTRSSTGIFKSLCMGLLMALAVLAAYVPDTSAAEGERPPAVSVLPEEFGDLVRPDTLCREQERKKHRCKHIGRATATFIGISAKRKHGEDIAAPDGPDPCALRLAVGLNCKGYAGHLRLSFSSVYAATRRMHI
jgi:hypothetical protein